MTHVGATVVVDELDEPVVVVDDEVVVLVDELPEGVVVVLLDELPEGVVVDDDEGVLLPLTELLV